MNKINLGNFSIEDLQFSLKESNILAAACTDGTIRFIDIREGK